MNADQCQAISVLIDKHEDSIAITTTISEIENALGCGDLLTRIEKAADPERGTVYTENDFLEFKGALRLKFINFTENFDYHLKEIPENPVKYIMHAFRHSGRRVKVSDQEANMICDLLVKLAKDTWSDEAVIGFLARCSVEELKNRLNVSQEKLNAVLRESPNVPQCMLEEIYNLFQALKKKQ